MNMNLGFLSIPTLQAKNSTYDFNLLEDKQGKMKKGSLRSKERSFEAILPRVPRIGVEAGAYACFNHPNHA
ncbi:hypothetical protein PIB30_074111 [Stylosanthes scabra]|uniref:Uncharacterized protein n=1 Tax=Stylosanthes scabra TaxID=79078 RepID=A0ABU6YPX8_9FABA|nr:hypothetical protein [Stylosanthes scabra]